MPWLGPRGAGRIVELLALGVAISKADWRERVGEGGGERSSLSAAVSIASPAGGGTTIVSAAEERQRVEGVKRKKGVGAMSRKKRASIGPGLII